ncbi:MAG: hypothetical protein ACI4PO_04165 [Faecousia sp.]
MASISSFPDAFLPFCSSLSIAGIALRLVSDRPFDLNDHFRPFLAEETSPDFRACFRQVDALPPIPERVLHEDMCYRVHPKAGGGYLRSFFNAPKDLTPYAVAAYDYPRGSIQVDYLEKGAPCLSGIGNLFFHLGFESLLIHRNRLCLHAACVRTDLGGILFSGPSGVGKSTQAKLWCDHRGARQINGDRPILSHDGSGWLAWGSPYAGSSRCHVNESCGVTAIVMLRQGTECSLRRLPLPEAFRAVWSGLTVCGWDGGFVETASALAAELIAEVPVFEFLCTPDPQAVDCLERGLRKECGL